ncbi:Z1 domain-containing protein [Pseudomonas asiatica]|uniref:Z1 domain-containing protein n=1 Tax=Pseudomonas asiatica TaxID=2219225 RepID=UPI002DBC2BD1|nr:Z1 domain-containing protein [Pseudomonas asiatica]MEB6588394.1 Z1 domain-containing protein [Pseudomonas asiatica]
MSDISIDPVFDLCRSFIERWRQREKSWDELYTLGKNAADLNDWFQDQEDLAGWPSLGETAESRVARWHEIINAKRKAAERSLQATRQLVVIGAEEAEPDMQVPSDPHSSWQLYRSHLEAQEWKEGSIQNIENAALRVLRYLRMDTIQQQKPVKGLVVGHVQSGKTANMAGLISMAADHRWNLFVVLSGTLENLRVQTSERLVSDLFRSGNLSWRSIEHPSRDSHHGNRAENMRFEPDRPDRHLIVCLKNPARLKHLIEWIQRHKIAMSQMRLVVIDDEADQAGINTGDISNDERSKINALIIKLINLPLQSVNYVAYTATPAANFLNEGPGKTLYPEDFIVALEQADEHFGPVQIFGHDEAGHEPLGIIKDVPAADRALLADLHNGDSLLLPATLRQSLLWFLCCVATKRVMGLRKPATMLIHTSAKQQHHTNMEVAVKEFLEGLAEMSLQDPASFRLQCESVWNTLTSELDPSSFAHRFPRYGRLDRIVALPDFHKIFPEISPILAKITAIELDERQDHRYHRGLHICVDNCANNGVSDENEVRRLFYPQASDKLDFTSAFIVIGGGTLSRGLTLENLVSTFFLRASAQADSLMQMGRWFGYRRDYELLPRIWMPNETRLKYEFMTIAEEDLRDDLERYMRGGARPTECGPRIQRHPRMSWLRPTGATKMQQTVTADFDFSGINRQTTLFHDGANAKTLLESNLALADSFLKNLAEKGTPGNGNSLVWRNVPIQKVIRFLREFHFHPGSQFFSDMAPFLTWLDQHAPDAGYEQWNVVVAGNASTKNGAWAVPGGEIGAVTRTRLLPERSDGGVSIGVLRDPWDLLADANEHGIAKDATLNNNLVELGRAAGGVAAIPQLLLYRIDSASGEGKEFTPIKEGGRGRGPLRAQADVLGMSLMLPGARKKNDGYVTHLTVKIPESLTTTTDDLPGTGAEV